MLTKGSDKPRAQSGKDIDWEKYGLSSGATTIHQGYQAVKTSKGTDDDDGLYQGGRSLENELFAEDLSSTSKPWWKTHLFMSEPVLFGTWDGVYTSCMVNIFGIIIFLRSGWIVAEAGIGLSVLVVLAAVSVILLSVMSGIGICNRCHVESGGVYFLISHVLGARIGGAIGLIYCFGQAVGAALHAIGFGESIGELLHVENVWMQRGLAAALLIILVAINMAGVVWVIKLQFLLLVVILLASLDFMVGSFVHEDPAHGIDGYYSYNFFNNSGPAFTENNDWFTVFGVFFPTLTGVFAGINMSGDLRNPRNDIPVGTLGAIGTSSFLYLAFILILGATCQRSALISDYMIVHKVSAIGVMVLIGIYTASLSACLATMYGTPRVLQSIAHENVLPFMHALGSGRGPNKVPILGIIVIACITLTFILIGDINTLAPIVTMPFLLTYAFIDYAYFSLAMTYNLQKKREIRIYATKLGSPTFDSSKEIFNNGDVTYNDPDLECILADRTPTSITQSSCTSSMVTSPDEHSSIRSIESIQENVKERPPGVDTGTTHQDISDIRRKSLKDLVGAKPTSWTSKLCNRWMSLLGVFVNLALMLLVHWAYALAILLLILVLYTYISQVNPGVFPGISEFRLFPWMKTGVYQICGKSKSEYEQMVVTPAPGLMTKATQQNEENVDFANRERYHKSSVVPNKRFDHFEED